VATAQVPCCRVAILFLPCVLCFASWKGKRAQISTVWQSRSILNVTPCHSAMMEACPPHHDDIVVFRLLTRTVR
jgi:hypothetical protein